jgi:hypothetical protein
MEPALSRLSPERRDMHLLMMEILTQSGENLPEPDFRSGCMPKSARRAFPAHQNSFGLPRHQRRSEEILIRPNRAAATIDITFRVAKLIDAFGPAA